MSSEELTIEISSDVILKGMLNAGRGAKALVIFSHGAGSSRFSPRNRHVAEVLNGHNIATFLTDLLTAEEDEIYRNRFNIELLTDRLVAVTDFMMRHPALKGLPVGYFGASTGAASALKAAGVLGSRVHAVVSRGGRPDLAGAALGEVAAPTLLIIGSLDIDVIMLNKIAYNKLNCEKGWQIVNGATHLFEEPGTLDVVAELAAGWFDRYLIEKVPVL